MEPPKNPYLEATQKTSPLAILALIAAIISWLLLPLFAAVAAVILAKSARAQITSDSVNLKGEGIAIAAYWIAMVQLLIIAFAVVLGLILALIAVL